MVEEVLLFVFLNVYRGIVDVQYCVNFRRTAESISYTHTYIHFVLFLDSFPI